MRILLVGEYSRLHNSLKEGLIQLGHEVVLIGNGDGFKNYPVDYSIDAKWSRTKLINVPRKIIFRLFNYDFAHLEHGIRFWLFIKELKNFDVVQLINERPIQTNSAFELFLLKKIVQQNKKVFLLSSGIDYLNVSYFMQHKNKKSILTPFFNNPKLKKEYSFVFQYITKNHKKIHQFVYKTCNGIIASDVDYLIPLKDNPKFLGLIANPINYSKLQNDKVSIDDKIIIFLGINQWNYNQKGILFFEQALEKIQEMYTDNVEIIITKNVPYVQYINSYNSAHIVLDQVFAYDQGYNALEAMAKGKVVFTGAEKEFTNHYQLIERVAVNAMPDVDALISELEFLINNPQEIIAIGKRARNFIKKEHDYIIIAQKYIQTWNSH